MTIRSPAAYVRFDEWTGSRVVSTFGTNAGATALPFQGWRRFKEAFAPELVRRAVEETANVSHVIDPFGGSGTTALAAQFLGIRPSTIEVNPFLADLIEAKIAQYDLKVVVQAFSEVVRKVHEGAEVEPTDMLATAPPTFVEPGVKGRYLFTHAVAARICTYRRAINEVEDEAARRLLKVLLAAAVVPASNALVSGKGRRYRRQWRETTRDASLVDRLFEQGVLSALFDLRRFEARRCRDYRVVRGDARTLVGELETADLAVFSPPYPNSFDYTDVYNIELWTLGYLTNAAENRSLREATFRSHVQIKRNLKTKWEIGSTLTQVLKSLNAVRSKLWDATIPEMVGAYFDDMSTVLAALHGRLRPGGRVYMVVGDSRYGGVDVPVANVISQQAPKLGFELVRVEPFRSMRASPQQGGREDLGETLVVLGQATPKRIRRGVRGHQNQTRASGA